MPIQLVAFSVRCPVTFKLLAKVIVPMINVFFKTQIKLCLIHKFYNSTRNKNMSVLCSKNIYVSDIVYSLDMFHYWFAYAYMSKTSAHVYTISLPELVNSNDSHSRFRSSLFSQIFTYSKVITR